MRVLERIDNFLFKVDWEKLNDRWKLRKLIPDLKSVLTTQINPTLVEYWKENYDMRFGQVLINLNIVPDNMKIWGDEDDNILLDQGLPLEEVFYWGSNYDKDMNLLPKTIYRLIKDLNTDHIENIYKFVFDKGKRLPTDYRIAFNNVLESRGITSQLVDKIEVE
jgi:hypothetical protein